MKIYECEVWFRHNDDKDFEVINIDADSEEEAKKIATDLYDYVFKVVIKSIT